MSKVYQYSTELKKMVRCPASFYGKELHKPTPFREMSAKAIDILMRANARTIACLDRCKRCHK